MCAGGVVYLKTKEDPWVAGEENGFQTTVRLSRLEQLVLHVNFSVSIGFRIYYVATGQVGSHAD